MWLVVGGGVGDGVLVRENERVAAELEVGVEVNVWGGEGLDVPVGVNVGVHVDGKVGGGRRGTRVPERTGWGWGGGGRDDG